MRHDTRRYMTRNDTPALLSPLCAQAHFASYTCGCEVRLTIATPVRTRSTLIRNAPCAWCYPIDPLVICFQPRQVSVLIDVCQLYVDVDLGLGT